MLYMRDNLVQYPSRKHAEYADDDAQHRYKRSPDRNTSTGIDDVEHFCANHQPAMVNTSPAATKKKSGLSSDIHEKIVPRLPNPCLHGFSGDPFSM